MLKTMIQRMFKKKEVAPVPVVVEKRERPRQIQDIDDGSIDYDTLIAEGMDKMFKHAVNPAIQQQPRFAMDGAYAMDNTLPTKRVYANNALNGAQMLWYVNKGFIGYQLAAMLSQQYLISKCCLMPAKDATRKGYKITVNDGTEIDPEVLDAMKAADVKYELAKNLIQLIQMGRIFGVRHALFVVESDDPDYYRNPFNADGITPGSYKGISQIDPYWITPQLDADAAGNPAAIDFYEPTWWTISGKLVHRSHLVIFRTEEVPDILKPNYIYGGIPIPQKIYDRVFAAESTANEAPMLAATKRTDVLKLDLTQAEAKPAAMASRMNAYVNFRTNYGVKTIGLEDEYQSFDVSLADLDAVIMTQFQLVAAAANVPAVKLMGTTPKGFNSTGEYEEASYHEELESYQHHDLTPLIERHHLLLIRSEIAPEFGIAPFHTSVVWNPLDAMTAEEQAKLNRDKAETDKILAECGAIDGEDIRNRVMNDPDSGYNGLGDEQIDEELQGEEFD